MIRDDRRRRGGKYSPEERAEFARLRANAPALRAELNRATERRLTRLLRLTLDKLVRLSARVPAVGSLALEFEAVMFGPQPPQREWSKKTPEQLARKRARERERRARLLAEKARA